MQTSRRTIASLFLASFLVAGCGGSEPATVEFKKTDTSQFDQMKASMTNNLKTKKYTTEPGK